MSIGTGIAIAGMFGATAYCAVYGPWFFTLLIGAGTYVVAINMVQKWGASSG